MIDWRTTDTHPEEFTPVLTARRLKRGMKGWAFGIGECISYADGTVSWTWTGSGEPTHCAPITPPEAAP